MALMEWDETMSVGVEELDAQHQQLIILINEAYEATQEHDDDVLTSLITKMQDYAKLHFATEEGYLKKYKFPDVEGHKFHHAKFNTDVATFKKKQFERTNLSQIFIYLSRWLTSHILDEDKQYVPYMPKPEAVPQDKSGS